MGTSGAGAVNEQGYALLIAATPPGKHPVMDATEALPALAAANPAVLLGTRTGSVVQLPQPSDPNTVLAQLRTAAAHDGPLLVYLAGQVVLDPRQHLPHLVLTRSTHRTVRYTGLPWHWLAAELAHRPPGRTTLVVDLVADAALWQSRAEHRLEHGLTVYGTLAPPPLRRATASPLYSRAFAGILRASDVRPPLDALHQRAAQQAELTGHHEVLFAGDPSTRPAAGAAATADARGPAPAASPAPPMPPAPTAATVPAPGVPASGAPAPPAGVPAPPAAPPDPHAAIYAAAEAGRFDEAQAIAAAWETAALRGAGPGSAEAVHWVEVRADLAHRAGDAAHSCTLWLHAASTRLRGGQDPQDPDVFGAVDRAHHCWHQVTEDDAARALGVRLVELRRWAPGRKPGALEDVRARLVALADAAPAAGHPG